MSIFDIVGCESKIGYEFKDKMLLRKCFTHASYANEHYQADNELLEFFGDAILEFIVTEYLVNSVKGDEGLLTKKRADMVSKEPLLEAIRNLDVGEYVLLGRGQEKNHTQDEKLYSSIYEALVAGIYMDGGINSAKKFVHETLIKNFEKKSRAKAVKPIGTAKTLLQEYVQKNKLGSITYEVLSRTGPDHMPSFRVAVLLNGSRIAEGKGSSKKEAESQSAVRGLKVIKTQKTQGGKR